MKCGFTCLTLKSKAYNSFTSQLNKKMTILEIIDQLLVQEQIKTGLVLYAMDFGFCRDRDDNSIEWPSNTSLVYEDDMPDGFDEHGYYYLEDNLGCRWFLVQQHSLNN